MKPLIEVLQQLKLPEEDFADFQARLGGADDGIMAVKAKMTITLDFEKKNGAVAISGRIKFDHPNPPAVG